ncbi:asparagine synthase (glutamine-hydrolyzing) [Caulobacter sp. KR2-114]|uniref:asparagine synthase (glutamine-hydrolyzing) n=1 Tax=Caulobacter sp. KR2-114 TaxID=3400912 RepID=UPI003C01C7AE
MCGILGEWRRGSGTLDARTFEQKLDLMAHRGPDGSGLLAWSPQTGFGAPETSSEPHVLLGHRRLAIIDLSPGGAQPMRSADGLLALTYNGEIYNYLELRQELAERHGRTFRSDSDTEVLLAAWQTWGEATLDRLDGMYAFILVDHGARTLTAARDPFGMKPLHYAVDARGVRLASEIRPLIHGERPLADVSRLFDYLRWGAVDEDGQTLFHGVRQLEPGELMRLDLDSGQLDFRRFWRAPQRRDDTRPAEAWRRDFRDLFMTTVERHLRADVPVVATLSGGLDSSAICGALRLLHPCAPIHVFSYVASGEQSEERWIDLVTAEKRLAVEKIHIHEDQVLEDLPALIRAQEQPFGSGSIYAQYKIFEAIGARGYKVMLDGQGADEVLAGYKSFVAYRIWQLLGEGRLREGAALWSAHARLDPGSRGMVAQRLARLALPGGPALAARRLSGKALQLPFLDQSWLKARGMDPRDAENRQFHQGRSFDEVMRHSLESGVLPSLLRYADRNAMAFSVENRAPFLSRPLVEMIFALPAEALISPDGRTKAVLRDALDGVLPAPIRDRHDKIGFRATEEAWMAAKPEWTRRELAACRDLPFVDGPALTRATERFLGGSQAEGQKLFRLIVFNQWVQAFGVAIA